MHVVFPDQSSFQSLFPISHQSSLYFCSTILRGFEWFQYTGDFFAKIKRKYFKDKCNFLKKCFFINKVTYTPKWRRVFQESSLRTQLSALIRCYSINYCTTVHYLSLTAYMHLVGHSYYLYLSVIRYDVL